MITACMSRSWKLDVSQNKKKLTRRDDQSAISSKEHFKHEAAQTYLSVTYQQDRLHLAGKRPQQRNQGPQQQQSTPPIFIQRVFPGKETPNADDVIPGRMHDTHWFLPWILSVTRDKSYLRHTHLSLQSSLSPLLLMVRFFCVSLQADSSRLLATTAACKHQSCLTQSSSKR